MKKLFSSKKLSFKIAFIFVIAIILVSGSIAAFMEYRILSEIDTSSKLRLQYTVKNAAEKCNPVFNDAIYRAGSIKKLAQANFDVAAYKTNPKGYFDTSVRPVFDNYVKQTISESVSVSAAFFSVYPDLTDTPNILEVFFIESDDGIVTSTPNTYEEFQDKQADEMQWFYGAFNSGKPYWTHKYVEKGVLMVSYVEPVIVGNVTVGVAGVDVYIDDIEKLVRDITLYKTGFALLEDNYNEFFESNNFIKNLDAREAAELHAAAEKNCGEVFEITLAGKRYMVAESHLINDYSFYIFAPKSEVNADAVASLIRFLIIFIIGMAAVTITGNLIGKSIGKPLTILTDYMKRAGETGDITLRPQDVETIRKLSEVRDEVGQSVEACAAFMERIHEVEEALGKIADGDLTTEVPLLSDKDALGISLRKMTHRLSRMFDEINISSAQVNSNAGQLANSSQELARGATGQASAVEELSVSIADISKKTKINAKMAETSAILSNEIKAGAEKGNGQMDKLIGAVADINKASKEINKVLKDINGIAFQTNILALNASVEAAHAGGHGKGFSVVANEVSLLANRSSEAAKNTGAMIENSIQKAELGMQIAQETAASLREIVDSIIKNTKIISKIAQNSEEQAAAILQINIGIDQVSQVIHQNSLTAEKSAEASEEMNSQAEVLQENVRRFKLRD